jgi:zinc transport system ATP-binding protein
MVEAVPPLVEIDRLTVRREMGTLLEDVSLAVAAGSIHGIVGPNGAGKSTLLAAVLGEIEFEGRITCHWRGSGRIGYVPQSLGVDRTLPLTVADFLALSRQRRPVCFGLARATLARVRSLLADVDLAGLERRPLGTLSGGERQRVLLAHAMDPAPELLVLDEPSSGLDESATARFEERLVALRRSSGATVLLVSHDLDQVRRLADGVTVLNRTVRGSGRVSEVLAG